MQVKAGVMNFKADGLKVHPISTINIVYWAILDKAPPPSSHPQDVNEL